MIVKYSKKFAYAPYLNYDVGFEEEFNVSSDDVEAVMAALRKLDFIAEKFHKENNPNIGEPITYGSLTDGETVKWDRHEEPLPTKPPPEKDYKAIERLEILIDDCATMDELAAYKDQVGPLGLTDMYHAKFDQLMRVDAENKLIQNQSMG